MTRYPVHSIDTAPEGSREALEGLRRAVGSIPNLAGAMASAPGLLKGFLALRELYYGQGTLGALEIQVLSLTNAYENGCRYCMALHSAWADREGLSEDSLAALREGRSPVEPRLAALSAFSRALVRNRGRVEERERRAFAEAGYTDEQALEVVLGVAVSVLPNFTHHLTGAPLDDVFRAWAWSPPGVEPDAVAGAQEMAVGSGPR